jgi:hypothetical protein
MSGDQSAAPQTPDTLRSSDFDDQQRTPQRKTGKRLLDWILTAFHVACDQRDIEVASRLLIVLEAMIVAPRPSLRIERRRHDPATLVSAHERLWHLRHPAEG